MTSRIEPICVAGMLPFALHPDPGDPLVPAASWRCVAWPHTGAGRHFGAVLGALLHRYCGHDRFALILDIGAGQARIVEYGFDHGCTLVQLARQVAAHVPADGVAPPDAIRLHLDMHPSTQPAPLDGLCLTVHAAGGSVTLGAQAAPGRFRDADLSDFLRHWEALARTLSDWRGEVGAAPLLPRAEAEAALMRWSAPVPAGTPLSLHQRFERIAAAYALSPALSDENETLDFAQLRQRAGAIAAALRQRGIGSGAYVALHLARSATSVAALLALLELNAVYVPVDPSYPAAYVDAILNSSAPALILSSRAHAHALPAHLCARLLVEEIDLLHDTAGRPGATASADLSAPFAMLFTSGSSGAPKAVLHAQRSFVRRFEWMWSCLPVMRGEVFAQRTGSGFGPHIWESLGGLLQGAHTVIVSDAAGKDPRRLVDLLAQHGVTRVGFVPSLARVILQSRNDLAAVLPRLRLCSLGGEPLDERLYRDLRQALPRTQVFVDFGSTEINGIFFCDAATRPPGQRAFPLGWPAPHARVFVLDRQQQPVPPGVPGDLYVGGDTLALGYREPGGAIVPVASLRVPGIDCAVFNTGDRVRYLPDGRIISIGRDDAQVKVRGMRVNLLQAVALLESLPAVVSAHVFLWTKKNGEQRLAALVQAPDDTRASTLLSAARQVLPSHLVPDELRLTACMPRLPNGKVDRREVERQFARLVPEASAAPDGGVASTLRAMIADIGEHPINAHDDIDQAGIGDLGIDSLAVTELSLAIGKRWGIHVTATQLFACDTVGRLTRYVQQRLDGGAVIADGEQLLEDRIQLEAAVEALSYAGQIATAGATLLTGATGYLGLQVLDELMRSSAEPVVCLVRAMSPEAGWQKLCAAALPYGIALDAQRRRITIVTGDMSAARLGLSDSDYAWVARTTCRIFHCAATVNHVAGYSSLRSANVLGTVALLELAAAHQCKHVVFASTIGVCITNPDRPASAALWDTLSDQGAQISSAYGQSKWLAEHLLWRYARRSGAAVTLFRIGEIAGHSVTGKGRHDDIFHHAIKLFLDTGLVPDWPDGVIDLMPVDVVARILVAAGWSTASGQHLYCMTHPEPMPITDFFRLTLPQACTYPVDLTRWRAAMAQQYDRDPERYLRGLGALVHCAPGELSLESYFRALRLPATRLGELLTGLGIAIPPIDHTLWSRYLTQFDRQGFLRRSQGRPGTA